MLEGIPERISIFFEPNPNEISENISSEILG